MPNYFNFAFYSSALYIALVSKLIGSQFWAPGKNWGFFIHVSFPVLTGPCRLGQTVTVNVRTYVNTTVPAMTNRLSTGDLKVKNIVLITPPGMGR